MKTILIPTDFNESSVYASQGIFGNFPDETFKLIFFHAYKLTDSISDLLMLSRRTTEYGTIPEAFHKACYEFKAKNKQVGMLQIEYFYGSTMAVFRNFAEANEVDAIFYPDLYNFNKISKYSIDPSSFLNKSGIPVIKEMQLPAPIAEDSIIEKAQNSMAEMA